MYDKEPKKIYSSKDLKDLLFIFIGISIILALGSITNLFDHFRELSTQPGNFNYIQIFAVFLLFSLGASVYSVRRWYELKQELYQHGKLEQDLIDSENRLMTTVELSPDTIVIHKDGHIVFINRAGAYLLGAVSQKELIGKNIQDFVHKDYKDIVADRLERMNTGYDKMPNIEIKIKREDGLIVDAEVSSTAIAYHEIPHVITIIRDISERKKTQEKLKESEERLQSILDNSTAVVFLKDVNGNYIMVNKQFEKLFNITREKIKWLTDYDLFPKDLADIFRENDKKVLDLRKAITFEEQAPHEDGIHTYISVKFPLFNTWGTPYAVCGIATDITERKLAEETKSRLATIVESTEDAITSYTLDGTVETWNPGAEEIYGYKHNEIIGKNISAIVNNVHPEEMNYIFDKIKSGKKVEHYETTRIRKDGSLVDVSITVSPIKDASGNITGASSISRNITEKKRKDNELRKYAEELALSNEELYVFSYAASHDLQEPLRNIESFITDLKKNSPKLNKQTSESILNAEDGVIRMSRLINDFLMYSRVNSDTSKYEEADMNKLVKDAKDNLSTIIKETHAKITFKGLPNLFCNPVQYTQVFQNLISNSIKYKGEDPPKISIKTKKEKGHWLFSVTDNGIGIEQWYHERIFIIFQKLHDHKKYPGSGIGLALCKRVIEKHGGKIWFESEEGKGTTFYFTFPI